MNTNFWYQKRFHCLYVSPQKLEQIEDIFNVQVSLSKSTFSITKADTAGHVSINCNIGDILFAAGFIGNKPSYSGAIELAYSEGSNVNVNAMGMFILKAISTTVTVGFSYTGHIMRLY